MVEEETGGLTTAWCQLRASIRSVGESGMGKRSTRQARGHEEQDGIAKREGLWEMIVANAHQNGVGIGIARTGVKHPCSALTPITSKEHRIER